MKKESLKKELLTPEHIRQDLGRLLRRWCFILAGVTALLAFFTFALCKWFGDYTGSQNIQMILCLIMLVYAEVDVIVRLTRLHRSISGKGSVVRDKLISSEEKESHRRNRARHTYYYLHFSGYGSFLVPDKNYSWSTEYAMSAAGVYHYALNGDEFYLVLSKPHTGKILMAYPCKLFELQEN